MGTQAETDDDVAVLDAPTEQPAAEAAPAPQAVEPAADAEEVVVTLGEEASPAEQEEKAPEWVRDLRKRYREIEAENRKLREAAKAKDQPPAVVVGAKPTLAECEFDEEDFAAKLLAWEQRKRAADAEQESRKAEERKQAEAWQAKLDTYAQKKAALKVPDFAEAEAEALSKLSPTQQGVILEGTGDQAPALIYALGKNAKKLAELAALQNPVQFAFAVADLKGKLQVTPRKPPPPESRVVGSAPSDTTGGDKELDRLRAEASKTGDRSKVIAYLRQQRQGK